MMPLSRAMLPLGLTDDEFDSIMRSFYRWVLQERVLMEQALCCWEDDGGATASAD